ncbi:MAG: DUF2190 family protein [Candidatus Geothermarchaeales archaeon]
MSDKWPNEDGIISEGPIVAIFKAGADITKNLFVKLTADGPPPEVQQATDVDSGVIGVALETVSSGEMVPVAVGGVVKIVAGGAIVRGQAVASDINGRAVALADQAVDEGGTATYTVYYAKRSGIALQSAVLNDYILVLLK